SPSICWATGSATSSIPALSSAPFTGGTTMTNDHGNQDGRGLSRRQLLKAGGLTLGGIALSGVGRRAAAQTPRTGGTLVSAQATEATGLDPQLVPSLSRSRRSPLTYNQLVRFDENMAPVPELAESWETSKD